MWLFTKKRILKDVLLDTNRLIVASEEADWAGRSPQKISVDLLTAIEAIENKGKIDSHTLRLHFAPTGTIQETAIWNGWHNDYMKLSAEFDGLIKEA